MRGISHYNDRLHRQQVNKREGDYDVPKIARKTGKGYKIWEAGAEADVGEVLCLLLPALFPRHGLNQREFQYSSIFFLPSIDETSCDESVMDQVAQDTLWQTISDCDIINQASKMIDQWHQASAGETTPVGEE